MLRRIPSGHCGSGGALSYGIATSCLMSRNEVPSSLLNGWLDNVCFFDRVLTQPEIDFLYNNGDGRESLKELARPLVGGSLANNKRGLV